MNLVEKLNDASFITFVAGLFAVIAGVNYFLSETAGELPTLMKYALGTVIGAGVLVYWLMIIDSAQQDNKKKVVKKNEIVKR